MFVRIVFHWENGATRSVWDEISAREALTDAHLNLAEVHRAALQLGPGVIELDPIEAVILLHEGLTQCWACGAHPEDGVEWYSQYGARPAGAYCEECASRDHID